VGVGRALALLAEHRRELLPDSFTTDFTSSSGRGGLSLSADLVESVLVLQALHDFSDGQAADVLRFDIRRRVTCDPLRRR
jgi:hypothetical protein